MIGRMPSTSRDSHRLEKQPYKEEPAHPIKSRPVSMSKQQKLSRLGKVRRNLVALNELNYSVSSAKMPRDTRLHYTFCPS
jgi:hypothetical protein